MRETAFSYFVFNLLSFVFQRSGLLSFSVAVFCLLQYFNNYTAVVLTTFFGVVGVDRF